MHRLPRIKVEQIMTKEVVTVNEDDSLEELAEKFRKHHFNGFPVIDKGGQVDRHRNQKGLPENL
jgi:CBS domain-containing protein